jgi:multidrug resistance efflux pump
MSSEKRKIKNLMFFSIAMMIVIIVVSFFIERNSQKLPGVVRTHKVVISAKASGTVVDYDVNSMQRVEKGDVIVRMENPKLPIKLKTREAEKSKLEEIISSADNGDLLDLELFKPEEDILKNETKLKEAEIQQTQTIEQLSIYSEKYSSAKRQFEAQQTLLKQNKISLAEFQKETDDFLSVSSKYNKLQKDSLKTTEEIANTKSILELIKHKKSLLRQNVSLLASKHLIDLHEVESKIADLKQDIESLVIKSPIGGIVTGMFYLPGENVDDGDVVAEISDTDKMWIIAYGNSFSSHQMQIQHKVAVYCGNGKKVFGKVVTVSPVMEKVKSLSSSFETTNTYSKIEIQFDNMEEAHQNLTPGERIFVRIYFK